MDSDTPPPDPKARRNRIFRLFLYGIAFLIFMLLVGTLGFHQIRGLSWSDSLYESSMYISGTGQVTEMITGAQKIFASIYAIITGLFFLVIFAFFVDELLMLEVSAST